jgi:hypothetical protein
MCDEMRGQIPEGLRTTGRSFPRTKCGHDAVWRNARKVILLKHMWFERGLYNMGFNQTWDLVQHFAASVSVGELHEFAEPPRDLCTICNQLQSFHTAHYLLQQFFIESTSAITLVWLGIVTCFRDVD